MALGNVLISPTEPNQSGIAIRLHGDMDTAAAADLRRILVHVIMHQRPARILVDLRKVATVDALVIGVLQAAGDLARDVELTLAFDGFGSPLADQLIREELTAAA
jgi:anti-anti-sigma regulatory factor